MSGTTTSTAATYQNMMASMNSIQQRMQKSTYQTTSGQLAQTFKDLSQITPVENVLSLNNEFDKLNSYNSNNSMIVNRLTTMDNALGEIINVVGEIISDTTAKRSALGKDISLTSNAKEKYFPIITTNLNLNFENRYLFSGSKTDVKPVNDLTTSSNIINNVVTSNYYQGNSDILSAQVSDSLNISYGVTANNDVFMELIATINNLISSETNEDGSLLGDAFDQLNISLQDLTQMRANIDNNISSIEANNNTNLASIEYLNDTIANLTHTNLPEAMTQFNSDYAALTASYMIYGKLSSLSLANYL